VDKEVREISGAVERLKDPAPAITDLWDWINSKMGIRDTAAVLPSVPADNRARHETVLWTGRALKVNYVRKK